MTAAVPGAAVAGQRLIAIDWLRGFVMVLMAVDHGSHMFNADRAMADSPYPLDALTTWVPGTELPPLDFFVRWMTHLCAPTFLFLSGTSLALSLEKRAGEGDGAGSLDQHLLIRGVVILACEGVLSVLAGTGALNLGVLFAIGASLLAMIPLRRLPTPWLLAGGLAWLAGGELVVGALAPIGSASVPVALALTLAPVVTPKLAVFYPFVHWLAMLALGWAFGRYLLGLPAGDAGRRRTERTLLAWGGGAVALFLLVRGIDAYGNMGLYRDDASWVQWLHVAKYPPGLAFASLELGLMALALAGLSGAERNLARPAWRWNPVLLLGQTALFFYMLHFILLGGAAIALTGGLRQLGLPAAFAAAAGVIAVLYPACAWYRAHKRAHPRGWPQYF